MGGKNILIMLLVVKLTKEKPLPKPPVHLYCYICFWLDCWALPWDEMANTAKVLQVWGAAAELCKQTKKRCCHLPGWQGVSAGGVLGAWYLPVCWGRQLRAGSQNQGVSEAGEDLQWGCRRSPVRLDQWVQPWITTLSDRQHWVSRVTTSRSGHSTTPWASHSNAWQPFGWRNSSLYPTWPPHGK